MIKKEDFAYPILEKSQENTYTKDFENIANKLDVSNQLYGFESKYEEYGVVRYGINIHNTFSVVDQFNSEINTIFDKYNKEVGDLNNNEIKSHRSGSSKKSKNSKKLAFDYDSCKILHPLEVMLLGDSIKNSIKTKQKAVLVDIFERNEQGVISIDNETDKPKTHTVVLCRKEDVNNSDNFGFLVIDPSNSKFSQHLGLPGVNKIIDSLLNGDIKLEVSNKSYKIYEQNSKIGTGLAFNKFRDCIDIAFKLAKSLNKTPKENIFFNNKDKSLEIFDNLQANDIVKNITNNKIFDSEIKSEMCTENFLDYPFRGKQLTSNEKGMELYNKQILAFHKINNKVNKLTIPAKNKFIAVEEMQNLLTSSLQEQEKTESFLKKIDDAYLFIGKASSLFGNVTEQEQIQSLGKSLNELGEEFADYYFHQ